MKVEGSVKHDSIVDAAIRRFSHFGINKTTLAEIADDMGISKPSLFYYFRDKGSLMESVAHKVVKEYIDACEVVLNEGLTVEEGLMKLIEVKRDHFKKYSLLALQADTIDMSRGNKAIPEIIIQAQENNKRIIAGLLRRGREKEVIKTIDVEKTALLIVEILGAFEHCTKYKMKLVESKDLDALFDKQREVLLMILNGLKHN